VHPVKNWIQGSNPCVSASNTPATRYHSGLSAPQKYSRHHLPQQFREWLN